MTINPGSFIKQNISFFIPKRLFPGLIVKMTTDKYIEDFKAYDYQGNELLKLLQSEPMNGISPMQQN